MKQLLLCLFSILLLISLFTNAIAQEPLDQLITVIQKSPVFDRQKESTINSLKALLYNADGNNLNRQFELCSRVYEEYKAYQNDSAYRYAKKLQVLSQQMGNPALMMYAKLKLGFSMLSSGMYKEAKDSLSQVEVKILPDSNKAEYFALMGRYYYDLADFDNDRFYTPLYNNVGTKYIDSALLLWQSSSYEFLYYSGLKELRSGNKSKAFAYFNELLKRGSLTLHQLAVTASTLSDLYIQKGENDKAIPLLAKAVAADIESSTKETSAAFNLATLLYRKGDITNASTCINQAFADAVFYSARQRKVQVSAVLPLIEAERLNIVEKQKKMLILYAVSVTLLLLLVVALVVVILKQVKKLQAAQKIITEAHIKEHEINRRLAETNEKLSDANKIKEEYIGYFFNVNSEFFDKIGRFKKSAEQKLADRKLEDVKVLVRNINLKKEKEELLKHFDQAFLNLFPNFVTTYSAMFKEEDKVRLKEDELLNTDLRIFALIRMGIHDNEKIAHILQYSVNTINAYKTRIKNKALVPNEEFEKRIMGIKTV
ncbi:MAG: hypothetical protein JWQ09_5564 [Segetibacter sp.]|nr:hypothetical protein [Segetibacter sp.]